MAANDGEADLRPRDKGNVSVIGLSPFRAHGDELVETGGGPYDPTSVGLYRLYNDTGALLYVGIANSPKLRFGQHAESKRWWWEVTTWTIDWYGSREEAAAAERAAIVSERPAYNVADAPEARPDEGMPDYWLKAFTTVRPTSTELNYFYVWMIRMKSLGPEARAVWSGDHVERVYRFACERARDAELRKHDLYVQRMEKERWKLCRARDERLRRGAFTAAVSAARRSPKK